MKKYFFFAAAALLALAACSKVTPVETPDQEIGFSVVSHLNATKADNDTNEGDAVEHMAFYDGKTFSVFAFSNADTWDKTTATVDAKYMNDVAISKQGDVWKAASGTYYWPKKAYLSFAAYSPSSAAAPTITKVTNTTAANNTINYAWDSYTVAASNKAEYADDLMVSDFQKDLTANPTTATHFVPGVPILFHHLLSKLTFKFNRALYDNNNVDEDNSYITLTKVEIVNHYNEGEYSKTVANSWVLSADKKVTSEVQGTSTSLQLDKPATTPTFADWGNSIIVIPQVLGSTSGTGENAVITYGPQTLRLTYTITTKYTTAAGGATVTEGTADDPIVSEVPLYLSTLESWDINKSIVYNVTIYPYAKDEIKFDPAVVNWSDGGIGTIEVK